MKILSTLSIACVIFLLAQAGPLAAQMHSRDFFYGYTRADAPELAERGPFQVGVRSMKLINPEQIDILNYNENSTDPRYDRPLTLEIWYPALNSDSAPEYTTYHDVLGSGPDNPERPLIPFEFPGKAIRQAMPNPEAAPYPLVIVSHGYAGSRVLLTYLTENLASKGYVVAAIDHTESTHADKAAFSSTLLNRTLDINFVLEQMHQHSALQEEGFLAGLLDMRIKPLLLVIPWEAMAPSLRQGQG